MEKMDEKKIVGNGSFTYRVTFNSLSKCELREDFEPLLRFLSERYGLIAGKVKVEGVVYIMKAKTILKPE